MGNNHVKHNIFTSTNEIIVYLQKQTIVLIKSQIRIFQDVKDDLNKLVNDDTLSKEEIINSLKNIIEMADSHIIGFGEEVEKETKTLEYMKEKFHIN